MSGWTVVGKGGKALVAKAAPASSPKAVPKATPKSNHIAVSKVVPRPAKKAAPKSAKKVDISIDDQFEWRKKYNPRTLKLGMVTPNMFPDVNDKAFFEMVRERVSQYEAHVGESLPDDFRKYLIYCGPMFFNWSACGITLSKWNDADEDDQAQYCLWCPKALVGTKCLCKKFFDGSNLNDDSQPGLIRFSHSGCGYFKFIVTTGSLKGTIWSGNPNCDDEQPYLSRDQETFLELLDRIYAEK